VVQFGFHASHEQFAPVKLLHLARVAEQAGFEAAMCSDHFHPWSRRQGQSGFAWSWMGSAFEATGLTLGVVCAPGHRYHPAIIAQASATLSEMYPDRFWLALGSGEALNESITGDVWPTKPIRNARLKECAKVIRALWAGETVNHEGLVRVHEATLFTRPVNPPLLLGAALTAETATWLGSWADGLITAGVDHEDLRKVVTGFREHGGEGKPMFLQAAVCYAEDRDVALQAAHDQWRHAGLDLMAIANLATPDEFDRVTSEVTPEQIERKIRISDSIDEIFEWLIIDAKLGFDRVYLHHVGRDVETFLERFGGRLKAR
jgi:coenzyme F420-dependent glucose-6-phosphate dehydrogenase